MPGQIANKVDDASNLPSSEWNALAQGHLNAIQVGGGALISGDSEQLPRSLASGSASWDFFADVGIANAYTLDVITNGINAIARPIPVALLDGQRVRFRTSNVNTGASTINVAGLGVKNITLDGVTSLAGGEISNVKENVLSFNTANDNFILISQDPIGLVTESQFLGKPPIFTYVNGTNISYGSGYFVLFDNSQYVSISSGSINLATTGVNALDTGTLQANDIIYVYGIYNSTTQVSAMIASHNATLPTLPSGYNSYGLIQAFIIDGTPEVVEFVMRPESGARVFIIANFQQNFNGLINNGVGTLLSIQAPEQAIVDMNIVARAGNISGILVRETWFPDEQVTSSSNTPTNGALQSMSLISNVGSELLSVYRTIQLDENKQIRARSNDGTATISTFLTSVQSYILPQYANR